jgi:hypothetical protein
MSTAEDRLEHTQTELAPLAEEFEDATGVDRRQFMFFSLVAAAASTFGMESASRSMHQRRRWTRGCPRICRWAVSATDRDPLALGNGEAPALQFQAYPGGTGALMEEIGA